MSVFYSALNTMLDQFNSVFCFSYDYNGMSVVNMSNTLKIFQGKILTMICLAKQNDSKFLSHIQNSLYAPWQERGFCTKKTKPSAFSTILTGGYKNL